MLEIEFPSNIYTDTLVEQAQIPCVCSITDSQFLLRFCAPLPSASGIVQGWELRAFEERAPAGAGGQYLYDCYGRITLSKVANGSYKIGDLDFFLESVGWCPIVQNFEYAKPLNLDDIDDF